MEEKGRIGVPKALMYYRYFPFWSTFFEELGWRVKVSDGLAKTGKIIYFEDSCLPMKLLVTHAVSLKNQVDFLFAPRLVSLHRRFIMCPKFRGAPDILRLAGEGHLPVIDETIDLRIGRNALLQSFLRIGERLGASNQRTRRAFAKGQVFYSKFKKEWSDRVNRLPLKDLFQLDIPTPTARNFSPPLGFESQRLVGGDEPPPSPSPVKGGGNHLGKSSLRVAFVGHPYNLFDPDINKDVLALTKQLGIEILTPDHLSEREIDQEISGLSKEIYWSSGREIVGALFHFLKGGVDGVIFLTSFKCGIDALLQEFIKRSLKIRKESTLPFLVLSFDEHTGREGLVTRLEAFKDIMESRKSSQVKV
jgi:predicted nucleotide-binding protein (sugar kinase/HSP70/actin superfamily)